MRAIHWLRSRQEEYELIYWLSLVAYDHRDRSLNNRIYLLYLIVFFSVWVFITLTLIASGGARLLQLINSTDSLSAACILEVLVVGTWGVFALWGAQRRCPVVFTEQDALLVCQMPINRRHVVLRWFPMPWFKSALPFWVFSIALGFSFAEAISPGGWAASRIFEYAGYGIRAWLVILPIHLALFALVWATGIYQRQRDIERPWLARLATSIALAMLAFLLVFTIQPVASAPWVWRDLAGLLLSPLQAGFGAGSLSTALLASWLLAALVFTILYVVSGTFSLSRAAQETREAETIHTALRYGLATEAQELKTQNRLGVSQPPTRLPARAGAWVLAWKDVLQSQRSFQLAALLDWLSLFGVTLSLPFLPDFGSRAFAITIWVLQAGKLSITRLRGDLACWPLVRQLPISHKDFLLNDLGLPVLLTVIISWTGLSTGALLAGTPAIGMALLLPGMAAGVAALTAFDVIRRSRSSLLINGTVPTIGMGGILLGLLVAAIPILIYTLLPMIAGLFLAIYASAALGRLAFLLAVRSYRDLDRS